MVRKTTQNCIIMLCVTMTVIIMKWQKPFSLIFLLLLFFFSTRRLYQNGNKYPCWLTLIRTKGANFNHPLSSVFSSFLLFLFFKFESLRVHLNKRMCAKVKYFFFILLLLLLFLRHYIVSVVKMFICECGFVLCEGCTSMCSLHFFLFLFFVLLIFGIFRFFFQFLPFHRLLSMSLLHFFFRVSLVVRVQFFSVFFFRLFLYVFIRLQLHSSNSGNNEQQAEAPIVTIVTA